MMEVSIVPNSGKKAANYPIQSLKNELEESGHTIDISTDHSSLFSS
jgi:hypothetical protein